MTFPVEIWSRPRSSRVEIAFSSPGMSEIIRFEPSMTPVSYSGPSWTTPPYLPFVMPLFLQASGQQ